MTNHKNRQMQLLERENDRLIDVIVGLVCVGGGFVAGIISYFY